jgi:hypothetical protein
MFATVARTVARTTAARAPQTARGYPAGWSAKKHLWHAKSDLNVMLQEVAVGTALGVVIVVPMAMWMSSYKGKLADYYAANGAK